MNATTDLLRLVRRHGVEMHVEAGSISLRADSPPPTYLLNRLRKHKAELIVLLSQSTPPPLTDQDHIDIRDALRERAAIQEFDGGLTRTDAENQAREAMRVYRFRLSTDNGWCTLVAPGWSVEDAERDLRSKYGSRLLEVREHHPLIKEMQT